MEKNKQLSNREFEADINLWGNVTDPKEHSNELKGFRYLVYPLYREMEKAKNINNKPGNNFIFRKEEVIDLTGEPEKVSERKVLECSLIDDKHSGIYGKTGLIINSSSENILATYSYDRTLDIEKPDKASLFKNKSNILSGDDLIKQTNKDSFNKVIVLAKSGESKVKLAGFFYKVDENGIATDDILFSEVKENAQRLNLPLVPLIEKNLYPQDHIYQDDNRFNVCFQGKKYNLTGDPKLKFLSFGQDGIENFISPQEFNKVMIYLKENKISEEMINKFKKEYLLLDQERNKPIVIYDKSKNISGIKKLIGYGTETKEIFIDNNGFASEFIILNKKVNNERILGFGSENIISPKEVELIFKDFNPNRDGITALGSWWTEIERKVNERWVNYEEILKRNKEFTIKNSNIWNNYYLKGKFQEALDKAKLLYEEAQGVLSAEVLSKILVTMSWSEYFLAKNGNKNINTSYLRAREGLDDYYTRSSDPDTRSRLYEVAGLTEAYLVDENDEPAENLFNLSIKEAESSHNKVRIAEANNGFALYLISQKIQRYSEAIPIFQSVIRAQEEEGNFRGAGHAYNNLTVCYTKINEFELAIKSADKAISYYNDKNLSHSFSARFRKSLALRGLGKSTKEEKYFKEALEIYREHKKLRESDNSLLAEQKIKLLENEENNIKITNEEIANLKKF